MQNIIRVVGLAGALLVSSHAQGAMLGLESQTNNIQVNSEIAIDQIGFDFVDLGVNAITGLAQFDITISNVGPESSFVSMVMFETDVIGSVDRKFSPDPGVIFRSIMLTDLPGGEGDGFVGTPGLSVESVSPIPVNGIDPGESLTLTMSMREGLGWLDLVESIADGSTRIGVLVRGFELCGIETLVSERGTIPAPGAFVLLPIAGVLGARRRR
ncbi:MAG: hypothetical protein ACF8GE_01145 [Phycisphaerales bacterium JB043]